MADSYARGIKKYKSFALFPAARRKKYLEAAALFEQAALSYIPKIEGIDSDNNANNSNTQNSPNSPLSHNNSIISSNVFYNRIFQHLLAHGPITNNNNSNSNSSSSNNSSNSLSNIFNNSNDNNSVSNKDNKYKLSNDDLTNFSSCAESLMRAGSIMTSKLEESEKGALLFLDAAKAFLLGDEASMGFLCLQAASSLQNDRKFNFDKLQSTINAHMANSNNNNNNNNNNTSQTSNSSVTSPSKSDKDNNNNHLSSPNKNNPSSPNVNVHSHSKLFSNECAWLAVKISEKLWLDDHQLNAIQALEGAVTYLSTLLPPTPSNFSGSFSLQPAISPGGGRRNSSIDVNPRTRQSSVPGNNQLSHPPLAHASSSPSPSPSPSPGAIQEPALLKAQSTTLNHSHPGGSVDDSAHHATSGILFTSSQSPNPSNPNPRPSLLISTSNQFTLHANNHSSAPVSPLSPNPNPPTPRSRSPSFNPSGNSGNREILNPLVRDRILKAKTSLALYYMEYGLEIEKTALKAKIEIAALNNPLSPNRGITNNSNTVKPTSNGVNSLLTSLKSSASPPVSTDSSPIATVRSLISSPNHTSPPQHSPNLAPLNLSNSQTSCPYRQPPNPDPFRRAQVLFEQIASTVPDSNPLDLSIYNAINGISNNRSNQALSTNKGMEPAGSFSNSRPTSAPLNSAVHNNSNNNNNNSTRVSTSVKPQAQSSKISNTSETSSFPLSLCPYISSYLLDNNRVTFSLFHIGLIELLLIFKEERFENRVLDTPAFLKRLKSLSTHFARSAQFRLLRQCAGLMYLSTAIPVFVLGINDPSWLPRSIISQWGNEIKREFNAIIKDFGEKNEIDDLASNFLIHIRELIKFAIDECIKRGRG